MSDRPTPETEAFIDALNDDWDVEFAALTTHAKRLERERDEARAQYETIHLLAEALAKAQVDLKAERDEARRELADLLQSISVEDNAK